MKKVWRRLFIAIIQGLLVGVTMWLLLRNEEVATIAALFQAFGFFLGQTFENYQRFKKE